MTYLYNAIVVVAYYYLIKGMGLKEQKRRKVFFVIATVHIMLFHALRDPFVFPDNERYANSFLYLKDCSLKEIFSIGRYSEWGYGFLVSQWLTNKVTHDIQAMFAIFSCMYISIMMWVFYKWSRSPVLSIFVFLIYPLMYFQSQYVIRQHMAISMLLLAIYYVDRIIISIPISLLAISFHPSAVVFFPFYFIRKLFNKKMNFRIILILAIASMGMLILVQNYLLLFSERYSNYLENSGSSLLLPILLIGFLVLFHYIVGNYKNNLKDRDKNVLSFLLFGFIVMLAFSGTNGAGRLSNYFIYILPIALPILTCCYRKNDKMLANVFVGLYLVVLLGVFYMHYSNGGIEEYRFYFSK